ncbi:MAG: M28 family peptidase [Chitinophagia bacterium]|nr:M28 family peptidase [Chitinophagia bacterium]
MKHYLWYLLFLPLLAPAQSKKKKLQAELNARNERVGQLTSHVQYLSDDRLEGRRTGTQGEEMALQYITNQYRAMGLAPAGTDGFVQEFIINEGKQPDTSTRFQVESTKLVLMKDFFPLTFSKPGIVSGSPAMALQESGEPWFWDLKEILEANKTNPHFNLTDAIREYAKKGASKGATALFIYNSSSITDNIQYNKFDSSAPAELPLVYLTNSAISKYFTDPAATISISLRIEFVNRIRKGKNIAGFIDNQAAHTVILGAHYDHLGYGEDKTALDTGHVIHNGADDNASGTAALIELTRMLLKTAPANNNYLILHFSGEELGLLGSKYWLDHPTKNISANFMINMDMVGRYDTARKLTIGGYGTSPVWSEVVPAISASLVTHYDSTGSGPSDHASFYRKDIPVLFLFTGSHPDYHKATDDWDKINYSGQEEIVRWVYRLLEATNSKGKLPFTKTREPQMGRSSGFTVSLGVIPDYGFTGTGMRIDGVSPGKLAEKLGLQAGDILLQLGSYSFVDVSAYMQSLSKFKKGDKTSLRFKRGSEEKVVDVQF